MVLYGWQSFRDPKIKIIINVFWLYDMFHVLWLGLFTTFNLFG